MDKFSELAKLEKKELLEKFAVLRKESLNLRFQKSSDRKGCYFKRKFYRYFRNSKLKSQENSFRVGQKVSFKIKRNDIFSGKILGENVKIIN